jgi:hypothetical protein
VQSSLLAITASSNLSFTLGRITASLPVCESRSSQSRNKVTGFSAGASFRVVSDEMSISGLSASPLLCLSHAKQSVRARPTVQSARSLTDIKLLEAFEAG